MRREGHPIIKVGDLVVVKDESTSRIFWMPAIVEEVLVGQDGRV